MLMRMGHSSKRGKNKQSRFKSAPGGRAAAQRARPFFKGRAFALILCHNTLMLKAIIQKRLEWFVRRYFAAHPEVKLVVVTGSVGKTSTKIALGTVLSTKFRVRLHEGNHNSEISAPLAILGIEFPDSLRNIFAWLAVFRAAKNRIRQPADVDVIVQELGTDSIGQIPHFGSYLKPDIAVVTAVSPEHMEFFKTMDAVAAEELSVANFSKQTFVNKDDVDNNYVHNLIKGAVNTYGLSDDSEYYFKETSFSIEAGFKGNVHGPEWETPIEATLHVIGEHSTRAATVAAAVGTQLGMSAEEISKGLMKIHSVNGRMKLLRGMNQSLLIDDTYNSSPLAAEAALKSLYRLSVPKRVAVFGTMNELGELSADAHEKLGTLCDPDQLAHVITIGDDANKYLAPAARAKGCHVVSFQNALEVGTYLHKILEPGMAVLLKGSQGGVFLEEAVKIVLHTTDDEDELVRQSPEWMKIKQR